MRTTENGMNYTKGGVVLPFVVKALEKIGHDIGVARRARGYTTGEMAVRMSCSRSTVQRLEAGDAGISMNVFCRALHILGMVDRLKEIAEKPTDRTGRPVDPGSVPKRVAPRRKDGGDDEPVGW